MQNHVCHRNDGQVELHFLPICTAIEGDIKAAFTAAVEQPRHLFVFPNDAQKIVVVNTAGNACPSFAVVGGFVRQCRMVVELIARRADVGRAFCVR